MEKKYIALLIVSAIITIAVAILLIISKERKDNINEKHRKTWNIIYYISTGYLGIMAAVGTLVSFTREVKCKL